MECPRCRADIREASRFCDECGSPSRAQCSSCGGENRPDAKFCSQCGIGLSEPTAKAGAAAGATAVRTSSAERRQLTVMFVDLVGSTALSARVDPEDLREVLGAYHKCVAETVGRFHGVVANYMGDGVLVYFGYPRAHEDDAEQAVRAALELVTAVSALKSPACAELQSRVGIALPPRVDRCWKLSRLRKLLR
jgi:class 3 adenylate cyclase